VYSVSIRFSTRKLKRKIYAIKIYRFLAAEQESPTNELRKTRKEAEEYSQFFPLLKRSNPRYAAK
jgi:hypothetical protein